MALKSDEIFVKIRRKVDSLDPNATRKFEGIFLYNITQDGKQVKQWTMDLTALKLYEGAPAGGAAPTASLTTEDEDFFQLGTRQITPDEAIAQGKIQMTGDTELLVKLGEKIVSIQNY